MCEGRFFAALLSGVLAVAGIFFTTPTAYATTDVNGVPSATITALAVTPSDSSAVAAVTVETLNTRVSPSVASSVQFMAGGINVGAAVPVSGGTALTKTMLSSGTHLLKAVFTPTDSVAFGPSTSNTVSYVVNAPIGSNATVTTLRIFPTPVFRGIPVVLLANIAPVGVVGSIQFMDGTSVLSAPVPAAGGFALLIISLSKGAHSLTAVFTPANQVVSVPSASPPVSLTVAPPL